MSPRFFGQDDLDKFFSTLRGMMYSCEGPGDRRQQVFRVGRRVALIHEVEVLRIAEEDAAQDERLHGFRVADGAGERQRAAPAAAKTSIHPSMFSSLRSLTISSTR